MIAIFDIVADTVTVVTPVWPAPRVDARDAYAAACERLAEVVADLDRPLPHEAAAVGTPVAVANVSRPR